MKLLIQFSIFSLLATLFLGCNQKKYFEPSSVAGDVSFDGKLSSTIVKSHSDGATLFNGEVLTKSGLINIKLPKNFYFLNEDEKFIIATNKCGVIKLFDKNSFKLIKEIDFEVSVASASSKDDELAIVLANNEILLYDMSEDKKLFSQKSEDVYALNSKIASPYFLNDLILFPTLDGKVVIIDSENYKFIRDIVVSSEKFFNNIIYLSVIENRLIASTPNKVVSVNPKFTNSYDAGVRDILVLDDNLYIFTTDGRVVLSNLDLNIIKEKKFEFAHFVGVVSGKYIYGVEKEGYLIAIDKNLITSNVFKLDDKIQKPIFTTKNRIYYDNNYFELSN